MSSSMTPQALLRIATILATIAGVVSCAAADADRFGIFIGTLDGRNIRRIVADPERELNHARVSPDKQWITFTRYNKRNWRGIAREDGGYMETEIMLARIDGSELQTLVPPRQDMVAANGYWSDDGKAIFYVSNDNSARRGQINRIDLATRKVSGIALDDDLWAADPHPVKGRMAINVFDPRENLSSIWLTRDTGGKARRITAPKLSGSRHGSTPLGDYDPKISPDGSQVIAMRHMGKDNWHIVRIDLASGETVDLSDEKAVDGVPEWSSDGKKLIFWHVDEKELGKSGLYTMNPDGRERRRIPLPKGYFYTMPAFFPEEGSEDGARIIFSAEKNPLL